MMTTGIGTKPGSWPVFLRKVGREMLRVDSAIVVVLLAATAAIDNEIGADGTILTIMGSLGALAVITSGSPRLTSIALTLAFAFLTWFLVGTAVHTLADIRACSETQDLVVEGIEGDRIVIRRACWDEAERRIRW